MEKNYSERVREIKNEVLNEIGNLLEPGTRHAFERPPFVHYIDGEVAKSEYCMAVERWSEGKMVFCVGSSYVTPRGSEEVVEGESLYQFDPDSLLNVLELMRKEIRGKKLNALIELVLKAGGNISFDGNFVFFGTRGTTVQKTKLMGVEIDDKGEFMFDCIAAEDGECWRDDNYPDTDQIDRIIEYVRKQTEKSPKELLALTDEQKKAVAEFEEAFKKLHEMNIGIIMDDDKRLYAINTTNVSSFESSYYIDENENKDSFREVDFKETPICDKFTSYYLYSDEKLYVLFK